MTERSPTRREFLAVAAVGGVPLANTERPVPAGVGNVSWGNVTDAVPDYPLTPTADVRWSREFDGDSAHSLELVDGTLYVRTDYSVRALSTDGTERWRYEAADDHPQLLVGPDSMYVGGGTTMYVADGETVRSLDPDDGHSRWRYDAEGRTSIWAATPGLALVRDRGIAALSWADGTVRWRFDFDGHAWLRPRYRDGTLYVGTTEAELFALSAAEGSVRWRVDRSTDENFEAETPNLVVAGVGDDRVLAWNPGVGRVYAFDAADGTERWRFEVQETSPGFPGAVGDAVYVNDAGTVRALDAESGRERWRVDVETASGWRPQVLDDAVYVSTAGGLVALSASGRERWRSGAGALAPLTTVGDVLVAADAEGPIYGLDVDDGSVRWRFDSPGDLAWPPVASDDSAFVGTDAGRVYALADPGSTPVYDALRAATSTTGLAVGGLLGGALAAGAYRRRTRADAGSSEPSTFEEFELLATLHETDRATRHEARTPAGDRVGLERFEDGAIRADAFERGVETWAGLDHEGVLDVRAWGLDPAPWVATELAEETLADRAEDLDVREFVHAAADAAETIHRAHREGVAHGGLAPGNVLFADGDVRVADWRLAAELRDSTDGVRETSDADAPEADTYRLAAMLADLLAGEQVGDDLQDVLSLALADDPADRYDSALAFADALRWAVRE